MSAFVFVTAKITDPAKWQEYASQAGPTVTPFGGEFVIRGAFEKVMHGEAADHSLGGVIKFPTADAIEEWHNSDLYAPLLKLREEAAIVNETIYIIPQ